MGCPQQRLVALSSEAVVPWGQHLGEEFTPSPAWCQWDQDALGSVKVEAGE